MGHIRVILTGFLPLFVLLVIILATAQIVQTSRLLTHSNRILGHLTSLDDGGSDEERLASLRRLYMDRVALYESKVQQTHLLEGMAVNRRLDGTLIDQCDSLLFSSLRFVALKKLGMEQEASEAWEGILRSERLGKWFRHPSCRHGTSRDMILGLLAALSQMPEKNSEVLRKFYSYMELNNGYFGDGPVYVSFMTPGVGELFRRISSPQDSQRLPNSVSLGFSTLEFDILFATRGYQAHLIALQIWLELEIAGTSFKNGRGQGPRSFMWELGKVLEPLTLENAYLQRQLWLAHKLYSIDPDNLFFKLLRLRLSGHFGTAMKADLLAELLDMPQFPDERLPQNCDRKADYLWQRDSVEYQGLSTCSVEYSAIDFLWLGALILESDEL